MKPAPTAQGSTFQHQTQVRQCGDLRSCSAQIPTRGQGKKPMCPASLSFLPSLSPSAKGARGPEDPNVGVGRFLQHPALSPLSPFGAHM